MGNSVIKSICIVWTSPNTLLGLAFGVFSVCLGGKARFRQGCIEFHGGLVEKLLCKIPPGGNTAALTLGHTILGQTPFDLDRFREHEHVHVGQYERWGPLFLPAYFLFSLLMRVKGKDPYLDNPFEVEAYRISDPRSTRT